MNEQLKELVKKVSDLEYLYYKNDYEYYQLKHNFAYRKTKEGKALITQMKQLRRQAYLLFDSVDEVYDSERWITDYSIYDCDGMETARQTLLNMVSKLKGVKVINNASGIKSIEVKTKNVIYLYSIHAFYGDGCYGACVYSMTDKYPRDKWGEMVKLMEGK